MRSTMSPPKVFTVRSNSEMWRVISAPSVPESRANFSASSLPWFFTRSSNALICSDSESCAVSVWPTTLATSELTVTSSASLALSPDVMIWPARRLPASSILLTRSLLRSSSSSSSESAEFFSESWTSSVRSEMPSTMADERCSNSPVMRSMRSFSISWTRSARSTNSSWTWPVLKLRLVVSRSEASITARVVSALASSSRSSRSPPRSPSARIMLSPAWLSAVVMCWPRSSSAPVMLLATSSTREAIASEISAMSWRRSICTPEMALRTCSAWPTRLSRWWAMSCSSARMRTSLSE